MTQVVDQIKIVEYEPSYAAAVAEMWNNSQDGWGGGNTVQTEEQVLKQEANSTNLHLYLALEGEKVVGYCSLSEYREDEGALYIPLLNVRGDYHGKKIGKKLVLKALERVIELKWPRLDLYTWPGNTKAVPLYKKCGFFWEERDDATHLMNFMPTVLHTEAVQEYFKDLNWYESSTRTIEIKPDGVTENDFHYYEYSWDKRGEMLKMQFERFGRGLRSIETDDYKISATVEDFKLVFGSRYSVRYNIKNKSGNPLTVSLRGSGNKNIQFFFETDYLDVKDEEVIEAPFFLDRIEEEQSVWRTHPTVDTNVLINGKTAKLQVGVLPKFPANVSCHTDQNLSFIGQSSSLYVDIENNYKETVAFSFTLPESELFSSVKNKIDVTLQPKSRCSTPIEYTLKKHGFYSPEVEITAAKADGSQVVFKRKVSVAFKGIGARFCGESEETYNVYNGQYHMWLQKFDNWLIPGRKQTKDQDSAFMYPRLGKPFSEEFSKAKAEKVEFIKDDRSIGYRATYCSKSYPGVKLHAIAKLFSEGLIEHHYEVENTNSHTLDDVLWLNNPVYHTLEKAVIPYENRLIELKDSIGSYHQYWKGDSVTENWIFSRDNENPRGLSWSKQDKINFGGWFVYFENRIGRLRPNEIVKTEPVYLSIGAFQDWRSFREYATQNSSAHRPLTEHLEINFNDHNPFITEDSIELKVLDYKASYLNGVVEFLSGNQILTKEKVRSVEAVKMKDFKVKLTGLPQTGILTTNLKLDAIETRKPSLFIKAGREGVRFATGVKDSMGAFKCDNGLMEISVAPDFYPGLYSLKWNNQEWLDSSFPEVKAKSWWNPWSGGIEHRLRDVSQRSLLKEKRYTKFVSLEDSKGNKWEGIKIVVRLEENEKYRGFEYHQYFLLLPGTPVVCQTTEIIQSTGNYMSMKNWDSNCFFNPSSKVHHSWGHFQNANGDWKKIYGGKGEQQMRVARSVAFGSDEHEGLLQIIADSNDSRISSYINKEVMFLEINTKLNSENGKRMFTKPVFFLGTQTPIPDSALDDLKSIRFNSK